MAYVTVPKDMKQMKSRSLLKFTKRQAVTYGITIAVAAPIFFIVQSFGGTQPAVIIMIFLLIPGFFISMYEKDGMPPEKLLKNLIRRKYFYPVKRPYVVEKLPAKIREGVESAGNAKKGFAAQRANQASGTKASNTRNKRASGSSGNSNRK